MCTQNTIEFALRWPTTPGRQSYSEVWLMYPGRFHWQNQVFFFASRHQFQTASWVGLGPHVSSVLGALCTVLQSRGAWMGVSPAESGVGAPYKTPYPLWANSPCQGPDILLHLANQTAVHPQEAEQAKRGVLATNSDRGLSACRLNKVLACPSIQMCCEHGLAQQKHTNFRLKT